MAFIFLYGRPGTGKTTLASTMTNLGYKLLVIDADKKIRNMENLRPLLNGGRIVVREITSKLTETTLRQFITTPNVALVKQPKGYLEFCDIISDLESEHPATEGCNVLVIDSLTSVIEHLERLISFTQKKLHFTFSEYEILLTNLEEIMYTLMRLQDTFKHIIVIAHEQTVVDEDTGRVTAILPAIKGSMRNKIIKYFEEAYRTVVEIKGGKPIYNVITKAIDKCDARTSRNIDTVAPADFGKLFAEELESGKAKA